MSTLELPVYSKKGKIGVAVVRGDDFGRVLATKRWCSNKGYVVTGTPTGSGLVYLHHLVFAHYHGVVPAGLQIDHKDRDKRNNTPENLRAATPSQQSANKGRISTNKSGYPGVSWDAARKAWNAIVQVGGRSRRIGRYPTREEAAAARRRFYAVAFPGIDTGIAPEGPPCRS